MYLRHKKKHGKKENFYPPRSWDTGQDGAECQIDKIWKVYVQERLSLAQIVREEWENDILTVRLSENYRC